MWQAQPLPLEGMNPPSCMVAFHNFTSFLVQKHSVLDAVPRKWWFEPGSQNRTCWSCKPQLNTEETGEGRSCVLAIKHQWEIGAWINNRFYVKLNYVILVILNIIVKVLLIAVKVSFIMVCVPRVFDILKRLY